VLVCGLCWDIHLIQKDGAFIYFASLSYSVNLCAKIVPVSYEISPRVTLSKIFVTLTWENMKSQIVLPVILKIIDENHYLFLYAFPSTHYRMIAVICLYRGDVDLVAYTVVLSVFFSASVLMKYMCLS
jgi:hypothetical protein